MNHGSVTLSVIIPTYNEEEFLGPCLDSLIAQEKSAAEILVIDGQSSDGTAEIAKRYEPVQFMQAPIKGRKAQMNWGASKAHGDYLLFIHADLRCSSNLIAVIQRAIDEDDLVGGGCRAIYDSTKLGAKITAALGNIVGGWAGLFGSSRSIFVRRDLFFELGGFHRRSAEEGYDLSRRLKIHGRVKLVPAVAQASWRRFEGAFWKTFISWYVFIGCAVFGIPGRWAEDLFYR